MGRTPEGQGPGELSTAATAKTLSPESIHPRESVGRRPRSNVSNQGPLCTDGAIQRSCWWMEQHREVLTEPQNCSHVGNSGQVAEEGALLTVKNVTQVLRPTHLVSFQDNACCFRRCPKSTDQHSQWDTLHDPTALQMKPKSEHTQLALAWDLGRKQM